MCSLPKSGTPRRQCRIFLPPCKRRSKFPEDGLARRARANRS
jgi:hypothetical protein